MKTVEILNANFEKQQTESQMLRFWAIVQTAYEHSRIEFKEFMSLAKKIELTGFFNI
jgi:hypothetical protein